MSSNTAIKKSPCYANTAGSCGVAKDKKKEPKGEERSWSGVSSVWEFQAWVDLGHQVNRKGSFLQHGELCDK